mgnify:CR=1 FL=1
METETETHMKDQIQPTGQSTELRFAICKECGHQIQSSAERLRVGASSFMCDQCYKRLSFPESVTRCCE